MTRLEAIAILDGFKYNPLLNEQHFEALDMAVTALSENKEEETKMDKLKELEKRMDRIKVLMDATYMNIEELLATAAEKQVTNCETCPLLKACDNHDNDGCYITWLKFLEEGRIE